MAGPRGRDRHAAPPSAVRRRRQGTRGPPPLPPPHSRPPLPLRPKSGWRQTKEMAAPHPPRRGRCTRGAGAPRPRQAPARPARCRRTADRRRPGRRKRSGPFRGRPGEDGGANRGGGVPPPPPPPAALTRWRPTGPRPTPAAARQPPRHEYTVICLCLGAYRKPVFLVLHLKIKLFPMFSITIDLVGKYRTQATARRRSRERTLSWTNWLVQ